MARAWLINSRGLATKVKNAARSSACQFKDCGANRECPNCHFLIDNSDVLSEWPGFPAGVKFDPSDAELLEHLAAKCGFGNSKPHAFINEFIPTIEGDNGIYYDHPENLPGAKKDGSSIHFFHKAINAYATGQRKRRKVDRQCSLSVDNVRWHKTGKTKAIENGVQKGCKKIMVLYKSGMKGSKPDKSKWVMHQYHLGSDNDEKEGQYVVSKIFYQQNKQSEMNDNNLTIEDYDVNALQTSPRTPMTNPPNPPRPGKSVWCDEVPDDDLLHSAAQEAELVQEASHVPQLDPQLDTQFEGNMGQPAWLAGESQADENPDINSLEDSLLCKEIFNSSSLLNNSALDPLSSTDFTNNAYGVTGNSSYSCGIGDFENPEFGTQPDLPFTDMQFCSQDSLLGWLDRL